MNEKQIKHNIEKTGDFCFLFFLFSFHSAIIYLSNSFSKGGNGIMTKEELVEKKGKDARRNDMLMIKTVRCHYNFLADYCNQIGREHLISVTSCFGEQYGEHFFTLIYDTPNLELKDC